MTKNTLVFDPVAHAEWMRDAMEATKRAAEAAKAYPVLDGNEMEVPRPDRAVAFHEKNSGPNATLKDALMDAMRFYTPPAELRDLETSVQVRKLENEVWRLKSGLQAAHEEIARYQQALLASVSSSNTDDARDQDEG
jgi:hypothetical protein